MHTTQEEQSQDSPQTSSLALSVGLVSLEECRHGSGRNGVQDKGTCPLAPSTESGLAEESHLHRWEQKSAVDKSPLGAPKIRGHFQISLPCLSVLISKMGTSGAYDWWEQRYLQSAEPRVLQSPRAARIQDCSSPAKPPGNQNWGLRGLQGVGIFQPTCARAGAGQGSENVYLCSFLQHPNLTPKSAGLPGGPKELLMSERTRLAEGKLGEAGVQPGLHAT